VKLFVAVPAYQGRLTVETARSLLNEQVAAAFKGHEFHARFLPGGSLVTTVRDQIAKDFMASDCDRLVFIDEDVSWETGDLVRLAEHPVDFVGGCYRHKQEPESYPIQYLDKPELWADPDTGLLEVSALPAGFLALNRSVFQRLRDAHPERIYTHFDNELFGYFWAPPGGGEDGTFCLEWRQTGGKVWLDPTLTLGHTGGSKTYSGNIGHWLKNRPTN
jgi:hypothetical protein